MVDASTTMCYRRYRLTHQPVAILQRPHIEVKRESVTMRAARSPRAPRSERSDGQVLERGRLAPLVIYLERVIEEYP